MRRLIILLLVSMLGCKQAAVIHKSALNAHLEQVETNSWNCTISDTRHITVTAYRHRRSGSLKRAFSKELGSYEETVRGIRNEIVKAKTAETRKRFEDFLVEVESGRAFPKSFGMPKWPIVIPKEILLEQKAGSVLVVLSRYAPIGFDLVFIIKADTTLDYQERDAVIDALTSYFERSSDGMFLQMPLFGLPIFGNNDKILAPELLEWTRMGVFPAQH